MSVFEGYINVDWSKQYIDNLQASINNNNGTSGGKLVNGYNSTNSSTTGTLYLVNVYATNGNQVTYLDDVGNNYYLCLSMTVSSTTPSSSGKGSTRTYSSTNTSTITFFGQYFSGGSPSPGTVDGVNSIYYETYYQIWSGGIAIGNPTFTITNVISNESNINKSSLFLTSTSITNGIYVGVSDVSKLSNWSNDVNGQTVTATLSISPGDISSTNTNIFTNSSNRSKTYSSSSSTSFDTTYYKDYTNNNYYQKTNPGSPPVTAGKIILNITVN